MTKSLKRILIVLTGALLLFVTAAFAVACGKKDKGETAKLTLVVGEGGTLPTSEYDVKVGENVALFVKEITPTAEEGLEFAGWYEGAQKLAADRVMPAEGLSLSAKFYAGYTVNVYVQDTQGVYGETAQSETGKAFYGEPFAYAPMEHFSLDVSKENKASSDKLGKNETFTAWLARDKYNVVYYANEPAGQTASFRFPQSDAYYGTSVTIEDGARFGLPSQFRFAGWATGSDGDIEYAAGDVVKEIDGDLSLFAVWDIGFVDMLGGADYLFLSRLEENTVYLRREGLEEKKGEYDPETFAFSFDLPEGGELTGRMQMRVIDGRERRAFFYYRDTFDRTYPDIKGEGETLKVEPDGDVVYTDKTGNVQRGRYSIDIETDYFVFLPDDGSEGWMFDILTALDGSDDAVFRKQDFEEQGYYYSEKEDIILYLDGLGGLEYHFNTENYMYTYGNTPVLVLFGYYEYNEDSEWGSGEDIQHGLYIGYTRDASSILFNLAFPKSALHKFGANETRPSVNMVKFDLGGVTLDGTVSRDDGYRALFGDKWGSGGGSLLYLDGFGNAEFGAHAGDTEADAEEAGEYEIILWLYSYPDEDGNDVFEDYILIRFVSDWGVRYFRLDTEYGEYEADRQIPQATIEAKEAEGYVFGQIPLERLYVMGVNQRDNFIYLFENGDAEVWSHYATMSNGDVCYVLYSEMMSTTTLDEGVYHFEATFNEGTGEMYDNGFDFTIENGKATMVENEAGEDLTVSDHIVLNLAAGEATYDGTAIAYGYTLGSVNMYIFNTPRGTEYYLQQPGAKTFARIDITKIFTATFPQDRVALDREGMLYLNEEGHAYFGLRLDNDLYRFVGEGTVTETGTSGEYRFVLNRMTLLSTLDTDDYDDYLDFTFKTQAGPSGSFGTFIQKITPLAYTNLTTDGYGNVTYTDEEGNVLHGTFRLIISTAEIAEDDAKDYATIYYFQVGGNDRDVRVLAAEKADTAVERVRDDGAGIWLQTNDNGLVSQTNYLVIDGIGHMYFFDYDTSTYTYTVTERAYEKTDDYNAATRHYEYKFTRSGEEVKILVGTYILQDSTGEVELPLYQEQIAHRIGSFDTEDGGHIESTGYPLDRAKYVTADGRTYEGNMYIVNINVPESAVGDVEYVHDPDGTSVQFVVYERNVATSDQFVFDFVSGKLRARDNVFRTYAAENGGMIDLNHTLVLDGRGNAKLFRGAAQSGSGQYRYLGEREAYRFEGQEDGKTLDFIFRLSSETVTQGSGVTQESTTTYYYSPYVQNGDVVLAGAGWALITADGFGNAVYIDRYGARYTGTALFITDDLGYFSAYAQEILFRYDYLNESFTLVDNSDYVKSYYAADFSSVAFTETKLIINGEESFYVVENGKAVVYTPKDGEYQETEMDLPTGATYRYGGTDYYLWDGHEITFTDTEFGADKPLTLKFRPSGAAFTVTPTFGTDSESYQLTVGFENGEVSAYLLLIPSDLTSIEMYPVTFTYTGAASGNTFTIVPAGKNTTYKNFTDGNESSGFEGASATHGTVTVDNRHIGDLYVGDSISFAFGADVKDSRDQALTLTDAKYTSCDIGGDRDFSDFRASRMFGDKVTVTGTDGVKYTIHFILFEARIKPDDPDDIPTGTDMRIYSDYFKLNAITIDTELEVGDAGKVTFKQFWYSETGAYVVNDSNPYNYKTHYEQYDLVKAEIEGNDVQTVMLQSVIEKEGQERAVVVRQTMNTITGDYRYDGFVFTVTRDGSSHLITSAAIENTYLYGELETAQHRQLVRFLYTYDRTTQVFKVAYLLTFTEADVLKLATFTETSDNNWTIAVDGGDTYTAVFRRGNGALYDWTLTKTTE